MSYFLAVPGQLCNISGPLRHDDFTIDLTHLSFLTYMKQNALDHDIT